jgi:hypothetical protein
MRPTGCRIKRNAVRFAISFPLLGETGWAGRYSAPQMTRRAVGKLRHPMPWLSKAVLRAMDMEMDSTGTRQQVANGSMRLP